MKNSVLILGIALVSLSTICNAKSTINLSSNLFQENILTDDNTGVKPNETPKFEKPALVENAEVFNPETVIAYSPKTMAEIITEGDKIVEKTTSDDLKPIVNEEESMKEIIAQFELIIESTVPDLVFPLYIEKTAGEIAELESIIESTETNEVFPLDFKEINKKSLIHNSLNSKKFIGMN